MGTFGFPVVEMEPVWDLLMQNLKVLMSGSASYQSGPKRPSLVTRIWLSIPFRLISKNEEGVHRAIDCNIVLLLVRCLTTILSLSLSLVSGYP